MKTWTDDNPKARLLKRKRTAILVAARRQFLKHGYGGTSMEAVAADAGVSIMTLYRHASSKDELFAAAIAIVCHDDGKVDEPLRDMPFKDLLIATGIAFQEKLTSPDVAALLRAVIAEHERFPALARIAFDATAGHLRIFVEAILTNASEATQLRKAERAAIVSKYVDDLFGSDTLQVLLGLSAPTAKHQRVRAETATARVIVALTSRHSR